ncbi:hypothetical protein AVEN_49426-1 [Araneus ventricosus]|uniref:Uncharacterized protein n=1 Tax=Araneus ventricosus TaxID=182803 RepID=A0A4Y2CNW0_ARAVE|nr:hypothetical protein AVEN_49426-1 [Araneus ventricosus]
MSYRETNFCTSVIHCRRAEPACDSHLSAHHHHWGNADLPGTDGSRWEQDQDYRQDGQTPPSRIAEAVVVCAASQEGKSGPEKLPGEQHFPSDDDMQTDSCYRLAPLSGDGFF